MQEYFTYTKVEPQGLSFMFYNVFMIETIGQCEAGDWFEYVMFDLENGKIVFGTMDDITYEYSVKYMFGVE